MPIRKKPTVENVAEEILRVLLEYKHKEKTGPNIDTLGFLVKQRLTELTQPQLDAGRIYLLERRLIGKSDHEYSIAPEGEAALETIDDKRAKNRRWVIGVVFALAAIAVSLLEFCRKQ